MNPGKGYSLDDPRPIAAEAPYTFFLPSDGELADLAAGDVVKLIFRPDDPGEKWGAERMWVLIERVDGDNLHGRLDNDPDEMTCLKYGDVVEFQRHHVIDYDWSRSRANPSPKAVSRCDYLDRCTVDRCVLDDAVRVHFIYRDVPMEQGEDRYPDSGWGIRGDYRGLSDEEIDARAVEYIALGKVLNVDDSWLHLIDAPVGSAFIRNWQTGKFEASD